MILFFCPQERMVDLVDLLCEWIIRKHILKCLGWNFVVLIHLFHFPVTFSMSQCVNILSLLILIFPVKQIKTVYLDLKYFFYVSGCGCSKYLPENLQEFLPTYLVSLEGKRRWLMKERKKKKPSHTQKTTNKKLLTCLLKIRPISSNLSCQGLFT